MKHLFILLFPLIATGCSLISPTAYIEKKECGLGGEITLKAECIGGYSSTNISENKSMITFEGNEFTSLQRVTDLAILHCADIALSSSASFISIEIAERRLVSHHPLVSIYCSISTTRIENSMSASVLRKQLMSKYGIYESKGADSQEK